MRSLYLLISLVFVFLSLISFSECRRLHHLSRSSNSEIHLPLNISGNSFIDALSNPVRLTCTNWPTHMETNLPEGLSHNSVKNIVGLIKTAGFNCVRYTYSIDYAAHAETQSLTVYESLMKINLSVHVPGVMKYNPHLINSTLLQVFDHVLHALSAQNIMVVLDNHVSKASWCCSMNDGNGWFDLGYFNTNDWRKGLSFLAGHVKNRHHNVVAFSLRNEVRAPLDFIDPSDDWLNNMALAADAVHAANHHVLVIAGGLQFATNLSFINADNNLQSLVQSSSLSQTKLLYEAHWYSWTDYGSTCDEIVKTIEEQWGFIMHSQGQIFSTPIFMSEVGDNLDNFSGPSDYFQCVKQFIIDNNLSFGQWVLVGSYYLRNGEVDMPESFGLLDPTWTTIKSEEFQQFIAPVQEPIKPLVWHG